MFKDAIPELLFYADASLNLREISTLKALLKKIGKNVPNLVEDPYFSALSTEELLAEGEAILAAVTQHTEEA